MTDEVRRSRDPRAPIEAAVQFRHTDLGDFLEHHSANLSVGGMFIKVSDPLPPGTRFEFRFAVGEDVTVIAGTAEVVWVRARSAGPRRPAGMGVRFIELDDTSREIIDRIVRLHIEQPGTDEIDLEQR